MIDPRLFVIPADPSNQEGAALTAAATRLALPRNSNVQLVIETERNRNDFSASFFPQLQEDWTKVYIADSGFKAAVYDALTAQGLPVPFYPTLDPNKSRWGYNDTTNSALLVAYIAGFELVTRMDAGTLPYPRRFRKLISRLAQVLSAGQLGVTSATYSKRLALRCELVPKALLDAYCGLIQKWTGINPRRQLTAGAASTHKVPGGPGVALDGLRAWAIDDADFEVRGRGSADLASGGQVYRSAPGFRLNPVQYAGRLALMVVVKAVRGTASESAAAAEAAAFLKELAPFYKPDQGPVPNLGALTPQDIDAVVAGLSNFEKLEANWPQVLDAVRAADAKLPVERSCRL